MSRKPRPDATLHHLPMEQQKELCEWLLGGVSYVAARAMLKKEFEVKTSTGALHDFYHSFCAPELLRRRAEAVSTAEAVATEAAASPGKWDDATIDRLKQMAFEMSVNPQASAKDVKSIFGLVLKARDQDLEAQKRLDAAKTKIEAGLDALFQEIKGNERAEQLFRDLQEVVAKS